MGLGTVPPATAPDYGWYHDVRELVKQQSTGVVRWSPGSTSST